MIFLAPHNDDEALFGAFSLLRWKPKVIVCLFDGLERAKESQAACTVLGCEFEQWVLGGDDRDEIAERIGALDEEVFAPAFVEDGNPDHNRIAELAPAAATRYLTYTSTGKQTDGIAVAYEPEWIGMKHQALACYHSQFAQPGRAEHFLRDIREYVQA